MVRCLGPSDEVPRIIRTVKFDMSGIRDSTIETRYLNMMHIKEPSLLFKGVRKISARLRIVALSHDENPNISFLSSSIFYLSSSTSDFFKTFTSSTSDFSKTFIFPKIY